MRSVSLFLVALVASSVGLTPAFAADARSVSLDEALAIAREHSAEIGVAAVRLQQAEQGVAQLQAALQPTVNVRAGYTRNNVNVSVDFPTGPGTTKTITIVPDDQLEAGADVQIPLFAPAVWKGLDSAKRAEQAAGAQREVTEAQVLTGVAQAFYAAAGARELVGARKHALEVADAAVADAKVREKAGTATRVVVARAELAAVRAAQALREAEAMVAKVERSLGVAAGADEPLRAVPGTAVLNPETKLERPELRALSLAMSAADARAEAARWRWAPTIAAFGQGSTFNYAGFSGLKYSWAAGVRAQWVGWDGGLRGVAQRQAELDRHEAEVRKSQTERAISAEVADATDALTTQQSALAAAEQSVALARETLALVEVQYKAGVATQLDLLSAQDAQVAAEVALAQSRFHLELSRIALARATGSFPARGSR